MEFDDFVSRLEGARQLPSGTSALCPAHDDREPSLSVNRGRDGGIVLLCHKGCRTEDVVAALGLKMRDLQGAPHIVETYLYTDDNGAVLYKIHRWANPKRFELSPPGVPPARRVLYRADALAWARSTAASVYVVEGEKDANRLTDMGLISTTCAFGAGSWEPHYAAQLAGCAVTIIADNDVAGRNHARDVAAAVRPVAASVSVMRPRYGSDVSDLLDAGWTLDSLEPLPESEELGLTSAADIPVRPIRWAWPGYVPLGKVTIIEGDPGDGKSILTTDLAARWTSGLVMPDAQVHGGPWPVIFIGAEDDPEDTVIPRLQAAGANLGLIRFVDHGATPNLPFVIATDTHLLARQVLALGVKIVILDPLMAFMGDVDSDNDKSVRQGLWPLYRMAKDTGAAVVVVRHLNKGEGRKAIYRGGGSIAFAGAARAVYAVGRDPENLERRVIACTKMNIAPEPPALSYSISHGPGGPYLEWHGSVDKSAQELLDGSQYPKAADIIQFLDSVVENGKPMSWSAIVAHGRDEGYTEKQLRRWRSQSRLTQIVGNEGRRSARWGYAEHQIAVDDGSPSTPICPIRPHLPLSARAHDGANGGHVPTEPARGQGNLGADGANGGRWQDEELSEEDRKEMALSEQPSICEICGTDDTVLKFAAPYWSVRCVNHNPRTYRGGS